MNEIVIDRFYEAFNSLILSNSFAKVNEAVQRSKLILKQLKNEKDLKFSQLLINEHASFREDSWLDHAEYGIYRDNVAPKTTTSNVTPVLPSHTDAALIMHDDHDSVDYLDENLCSPIMTSITESEHFWLNCMEQEMHATSFNISQQNESSTNVDDKSDCLNSMANVANNRLG